MEAWSSWSGSRSPGIPGPDRARPGCPSTRLRVCSRTVALLNVDSVSVRFGGLQALSAVTIDVPENEVTGLIGPNGAGKTTLFNVVTGLQPPTGGTISLDGRDITNVKPHQRARLGISRTFQRLETFGTLSVRDNVLVAAEMRRGWSREKFKPGDLADELVERLGLRSVAKERVDRLPTGTQRLVEMARALATKPRVVLLDEPSAGLNESETTELAELLIELAATGLAILLVEHDMGLVMSACHHIHVLDGVRANHLLQRGRADVLLPLKGRLGASVTGEFFDRRTFYQQEGVERAHFKFPQFRAALTWRTP